MLPTPLPMHWVIAYTAAGAIVYWCKWGPDKLRAYALSRILDLFPLNPRWRGIIEVLTFTVLGCFLGIGILQPVNPQQAVTAGFAWTGIFARLKKPNEIL
jgi:hypothetical protein